MERIYKLPFISGCMAAVVAGIASYATGAQSKIIYLRMAVLMVVFFIVGLYVRDSVLSIGKEVQEKKERQQQEAEEMQKQDSIKNQSSDKPEPMLDLTASDEDGDFEPLTVSQVIKKKLNE